MRDYFKYEFGYVNVDDENLYLTNTGNWSEVARLEERKVGPLFNFRSIWFLVFLGAALIIYIAKALIHLNSSLGVLGLLAAAFGFYKLYKYFSNELGPAYKLPLKKLLDIEIEGNNALLLFRDSENDEVSEKLAAVDAKGLQILTGLKEKLPARKIYTP